MKLVRMMLLLLLGLPIAVQAQFTATTNNGAFVITGYTGPGGAVTIPGKIAGLPVIIRDYALEYQNTLTNVTILNGAAYIGSNSFFDCANLANVVIPGSVTNIGGYAFNFCANLTNVVISNGVANIGEGAFRATGPKNMVIPGSVGNIGPSAFDGCYKMTNVTISSGVQYIGSNAFFDCTQLRSVSIPGSVLSVGVGAFEDCSSLTNIAVDSLNPNYASVSGVLFDKALTTLVEFPGGAYNMLNYTIPASVTSIGDSAFEECVQTSVTIPEGVNSIGNYAFSGSFQLPSMNIPASVTNIGVRALAYCLKMTNITVDPANPNYASAGGVLFDKTFGTLIRFPAGNMGSYVISNSVGNIESAAFESSGLTAVTIPNSVTNIGDWAFRYSSLNNVTVPGSVGSIGENAFWNCNDLTNVTLLDGVTNIGSWAFGACYSLPTVTIPASVQTIDDFAFYMCPDLTNVYCYGNAPVVLNTLLSGSSEAFYGDPGTIYYLPGTTGWTNTLGGLPTAPWQPMILQNGAGAGGQTNPFGFTISWAMNTSVVVEACTNLFQPVWRPIQTNTFTGGTVYFSDPGWTNYPNRYYRIRSM